MRRTLHTNTIKFATFITAFILSTGFTAAVPDLTGVSYDPAFISAGDRVNISANLRETQTPETVWNSDRQLKVTLEPDNRLTDEYVTIEDNQDSTIGFLYPDGIWNQRFQVKVDGDAPQGMYDFKLRIKYLENGELVEIPTSDGSTISYIERFSMPVDREGVDLTGDVSETNPAVPRPGDNYVEIELDIVNTGNKPVEEVEIIPETPELIEPSYSKDERLYINRLDSGQSSRRTVSVNLDEDLTSGVHWINLSTSYEDESSNPYSEVLRVPLRIEGRPDLEIVNSSFDMKAGESSDLYFKVRNVGEQDAESVTARVIAERSQPFSLEDRSNYLGEIESGEAAEGVLRVSADRAADLKKHQLKIQLRANGDSEEGDMSTYSYTENISVDLAGRTDSQLIYLGLAGGLLIIAFAVFRYLKTGKQDEEVKE